MIHLNMTVEIDVCADDKWGSSRAWVENEVMNNIANAVSDMFEYPILFRAELEDFNIDDTDGGE